MFVQGLIIFILEKFATVKQNRISRICNVFIFVAVDGYKKSKDNVSKYLSLFFGVIGFVITGTEHVVADMFYFAVAGNYTSKAFIVLLIVFLGNTVGGRLYSLIEEKFL